MGTRPSIIHRYTIIELIREKSSFLRETHVFIYNVAREGGERERIPLSDASLLIYACAMCSNPGLLVIKCMAVNITKTFWTL